ncbi:MAG TPA: autotransporter domain-containing protein [Arenimonas sp.]|uniref:autotransporter domain-containing protein n=1 Tax=Arenimonas sp. TaxID=1872635 RepID=UPI002C0A77CB|nr:autotransporter domain-containing protein [Arenimonas sp.]HMB57873.1 autotransporter domain-containing protein [Arenimonas sp.]
MTDNTVGIRQTRRSASAQVTRFLILTLLLLGSFCGQAFAQSCDINAVSATTQDGPAGGTVTFTFTTATACAPTVNGNINITSNTTGPTASLSTGVWSAPFATNTSFTVNLGAVPGGTGTVDVTCSTAGCGPGSLLTFTFGTLNNHVFVQTSPAAATTNVQTATTLTANLQTNGAPGTYSVNFSGIGTVAPVGGNVSAVYSNAIAGTYVVTATVVCPVLAVDPACPSIPALTYTITVEASGMSTVSPAAVSTPAGTPVTMTARLGGATVPAPNGSTILWNITQPAGGDGVLSGITTTVGGNSNATITATVPGAYTVTALTTCTFCFPSSTTFTITVTAIVRTLTLVSGNNQTGAPGATLPLPLTVQAQNNGVPTAGITINYLITSGTGTLSAAAPTNAAGNTGASLTLPATTGTITVRAARTDNLAAFVDFTVNAGSLRLLPNLTPAGRAVATAIDQFCPQLANIPSTDPNFLDLRQRCNDLIAGLGSDPNGVTAALEELYADVALVQSMSGRLASQAQFDNIKVRIAALRSGTHGVSFGGLALNNGHGSVPLGSFFDTLLADDADKDSSKEVGADFSRWGFFAAGSIGRGDSDRGIDDPAYKFDIKGLTAGVDYRYSDKLIFGATLGYTKQDNKLTSAEGDLNTSGWSVSGYGTYYHADSWYSDAVLTYGHNSYDMDRWLHYAFILPGGTTTVVNQFSNANSGGTSLSLAASFGRDFNKGAWGFGPYARGMYTRQTFDSMTEQLLPGLPGSGLALVVDTRNVTSLSSVVGGKLTFAHSASWGVLIPHLQLEWQHEFKSDPAAVEAHFLYDPTSTPFTIHGDRTDTDFYRIGLGLSMVLTHGRSGFFYYEKLVGKDGVSQDNLALGLRIEF